MRLRAPSMSRTPFLVFKIESSLNFLRPARKVGAAVLNDVRFGSKADLVLGNE
jgi:hypothetical protein